MSEQKNLWVEKLIEALSKNLGLLIETIGRLGENKRANPNFALAILAIPATILASTLFMIVFANLVEKFSHCNIPLPIDTQKHQENSFLEERFNQHTNDRHLKKQFDFSNSEPSKKPSDRRLEIFLDGLPIMNLPLSNEFKSNNPFVSPNFHPNAPPDLRDNTNVLSGSHLQIFLTKDDQIDWDKLSAFSSRDLLDEFEILDNSLISNNLGEDILLLSLAKKRVKAVPEPSSIVALLAIAIIGHQMLKKKNPF